MRNIILTLIIFLAIVGVAKAVERINDNCYKFEGVLVCEAEKIKSVEIEKVISPINEPIKKEDDAIIKTFWTYGNEVEK